MMTRVKQSRLDLLDALPKDSVIAELGVFCGDFSEQILERCSPRQLFLVDTFNGLTVSGDENGENIRRVDMSKMRWELEVRFSRKPVTIVKADSIQWLSDQDADSLDVVYVDTTHTLEQTTSELTAALHAVKFGGVIAGHDYHPQFGVPEAVALFVNRHNLDLTIWEKDKLASYTITRQL